MKQGFAIGAGALLLAFFLILFLAVSAKTQVIPTTEWTPVDPPCELFLVLIQDQYECLVCSAPEVLGHARAITMECFGKSHRALPFVKERWFRALG